MGLMEGLQDLRDKLLRAGVVIAKFDSVVAPTIEVVENCQLEWDKARGVLYVHDKDTGATVLRVCRLQKANAAHVLGSFTDGLIDLTGPFEHASYPAGIKVCVCCSSGDHECPLTDGEACPCHEIKEEIR